MFPRGCEVVLKISVQYGYRYMSHTARRQPSQDACSAENMPPFQHPRRFPKILLQSSADAPMKILEIVLGRVSLLSSSLQLHNS